MRFDVEKIDHYEKISVEGASQLNIKFYWKNIYVHHLNQLRLR